MAAVERTTSIGRQAKDTRLKLLPALQAPSKLGAGLLVLLTAVLLYSSTWYAFSRYKVPGMLQQLLIVLVLLLLLFHVLLVGAVCVREPRFRGQTS